MRTKPALTDEDVKNMAAAASSITNADQLAFQPTQSSRLVEDAGTFDDLAGTVALARSYSPDLSQAALFVPIRQSLVASDLYRNRILTSSVRGQVIYTHSPRLATSFHGNYTSARQISSTNESDQGLPFLDSTAENVGVEVRYGRSERSQFTAAFDWAQTAGAFTDEGVFMTVGYGWSGRKWFTTATGGAAFRLSTIYVDGDPRDAADTVELRCNERGANVQLVGPDDAGVFAGRRKVEHLPIVSPVQAYLDLLSLPERADEAAQHLRTEGLLWSS